MSINRTITLSPDLDPNDAHALTQAIEYHGSQIVITDDVNDVDLIITPDMFPNTSPYKIGHILDVIEEKLFSLKNQEIIKKGPYLLNRQKQNLSINDIKIDLNDRECDVVAYLLNAGEKGCLREDLLTKIWGYKADLETHAVETQIYRLRQKIEKTPDMPQYLITIENGYRLSDLDE